MILISRFFLSKIQNQIGLPTYLVRIYLISLFIWQKILHIVFLQSKISKKHFELVLKYQKLSFSTFENVKKMLLNENK